MPNYENGKIYKLVSPHTDEIYIGSTVQKLCQRMGGHRRKFREGTNKYTSAKLFELGDVKIILIEDFPCDRNEQLLKRERYYIENFNCVNKCIPGRTRKELVEDNKELYAEKYKVYREKNKEKIAIKRKKYCEKNKEKIAQQRKEYYEKNKEKFLKQMSEYGQKNKLEIALKGKVKYTCECGSTLRKSDKNRHEKSKKHQKHLLQNI